MVVANAPIYSVDLQYCQLNNLSSTSSALIPQFVGFCCLYLLAVLGLDDMVAVYAEHFLSAAISGQLLLTFTNDDLLDLGIVKVGHQELLLHSIGLLDALVRLLQIFLQLWTFLLS